MMMKTKKKKRRCGGGRGKLYDIGRDSKQSQMRLNLLMNGKRIRLKDLINEATTKTTLSVKITMTTVLATSLILMNVIVEASHHMTTLVLRGNKLPVHDIKD